MSTMPYKNAFAVLLFLFIAAYACEKFLFSLPTWIFGLVLLPIGLVVLFWGERSRREVNKTRYDNVVNSSIYFTLGIVLLIAGITFFVAPNLLISGVSDAAILLLFPAMLLMFFVVGVRKF